MNETQWNPIIVSASCAPSPAEAFQPFLLQVFILDIFGGEQEETKMSGEFMSGGV